MARHELWVELADRPGNLAALAGDLAACGANIVHLDVHPGPGDTVIDRLVVQVPDARSDDLAAVAARYRAAARPADQVLPRPTPTPPPRRPGPARRPPTTLERLVALADGGLVRLRHLSAGDRDEVVAHHARCSDATRRHSRFLVAEALPPAGDGTHPGGDGRHRVALAALVGADIVGVARYDLDRSLAVADLAVMVEDRHQRRGIGTLLVTELALLASNAEVRHLRSVDRSGGVRLPGTLRRAGLAYSMHRDGGSLVLDCALPQDLSASA
jgi:GNAT superfamily N-acetyltransferase